MEQSVIRYKLDNIRSKWKNTSPITYLMMGNHLYSMQSALLKTIDTTFNPLAK